MRSFEYLSFFLEQFVCRAYSDTRLGPRSRSHSSFGFHANKRRARDAEMSLESDHRATSKPWQKRQQHYSRPDSPFLFSRLPRSELAWRHYGAVAERRGSVTSV